jgi:hypothetical protein
MPQNSSRFAAALYDQFEDERQVADWGGDELFTRMPRPRAVDDAPPPRFRPALALVEPADDRSPTATAEESMRARAERLGLSVVDGATEPAVHRFDASGSMVEPPHAGRRTKLITGHPGGAPRPLPTVAARRPPRAPADWIGPRPERIVGWAFALGLLLILIALLTG